MGDADSTFAAMGRIILFHRRRGEGIAPVTIVTLRVSLAAVALLVVCRIMGLRLPREWAVWRAFFGMGLLNNIIPFCLIVWGQTQIASGLARSSMPRRCSSPSSSPTF